ncbi:calmegin [Pimephales promelas]|uniref:calmegin n=1 Tax=Pimephales promelas TaxID=90988 RepID=UPI001955A72E|nr:calmegin [Pimephales promelas]KAG1956497.1 calnexin [Pimephales promelas]KAG1956498.1 calnexin [Pimephales promelas]KAG1956499.1 calnexin [Pimephales promelas]
MKLRWGWTCLLLLSISMVTWAQEEDLEDEEEAQVEDGDVDVDVETDSGESIEVDANVSFQVTYKTPVPTGDVFFTETFDDGSLGSWQVSKTMKEDADEDIAKYDGKWVVEPLKENKVPGDLGLVLKSRAKHHAIAALLNKPFVFEDKPLIVQYEVNFQDGIDCGGAYIKLLSDSEDLDLEQFHDRTPYSIMFGPDKCGEDYKLHFIFRHKNPLNGDVEEKHAKRPDVDLKKIYTDKKTHLYTLVLNPDNSYEIFIDQSSVSKGNMLTDVVPPVNPPKEIDDPKDSKPEDWDERAKIPDPEAVKPDDWDEDAPAKVPDPDAVKPDSWLDDEPEFVSDPTAEKPEDWDEEMDGEWEAPQVPNPACTAALGCGEWKPPMVNNPQYKGKWRAPLIDNPNYQGVWSPRKVANPDYFEDLHPFRMEPFRAVGLELWSMTSDIYFDNFIVTAEKEVADRWAADSWGLKKLVASANEPGVLSQLALAAEERPWLWVVYILTVGLPIGLAVLFCWPKKSDDYVYKKIDQPKAEPEEVEDDDEEEEEKEEEKDEDEAKTDEANVDKNEDRMEKDIGEDGGDTDEEEEEADKPNGSASEDEMKDANEEIQGSGEPKAVRKRRVRKD